MVERYTQISRPVIEEMKKDLAAGTDWQTLAGAVITAILGSTGLVTFLCGTPNNRKGTIPPEQVKTV